MALLAPFACAYNARQFLICLARFRFDEALVGAFE